MECPRRVSAAVSGALLVGGVLAALISLHSGISPARGGPLPSLPIPSVPIPSLPLPSLPLPSIPLPSIPLPSIPLPSLPQPSVVIPSVPLSASPAPSPTPRVQLTPNPSGAAPTPGASTGAAGPDASGSAGTSEPTASPRRPGPIASEGVPLRSSTRASPAAGDAPAVARPPGGTTPGVADIVVPALALGVPLVLILALIAAQLGIGAAWLPFTRRVLGSVGIGRAGSQREP